MKTLIPFLTIITLGLTIASCNKSNEDCTNGDCVESAQWEWVRTYGTIAGGTWTPQSTNMTKSVFMDETMVVFFEDGAEVDRFEYEVFDTDTIDNDNVIRKFIKFNGNVRRYEETDLEMSMIDLCCDGLDDYYEKK